MIEPPDGGWDGEELTACVFEIEIPIPGPGWWMTPLVSLIPDE